MSPTHRLQRADSLEAFSDTFLGRVHALTAPYTLLSRENWSSVQLVEILTEELRPFMAEEGRNIHVEGPAVSLPPRGALALGMLVHELATNAAKYGALSAPEGSAAVTWTVQRTEGEEILSLDWTERDGPPVIAPARQGFGTKLIKRSLAHDLSGKAEVKFLPTGVQATVTAPLGNLAAESAPGLGRSDPS